MTTIALITGANKGIGLATARLLGEAGMTVLIGARNAERGEAAAKALAQDGLDASFIPLDVTNEVSARAAADTVAGAHGRLDILVNNAGIAIGDGTRAAPSQTRLEAVRTVFETNVFGVVAVTNALLPLLRESAAGRIVNVSSEVGSIGSMLDQASPLRPMASIPYPASKAALNMVTAMYAKELAATTIKVNAANPGYCATDLNGNTGFRSARQGAEVCLHLATLPSEGPTGTLWGYLWASSGEGSYGELPW
jgi:NAD(P)-dependent dehydrogenase (short-subunit alcohol dehydrogenase family)